MLTALVQTDDDEVEIRQSTSRSMRPPPRAYKNRSRGIVDTLRTILETAQTNLAALRKTETTAVQEYERMKSTLQHSIETDTKAVSTYKETYSESHSLVLQASQTKTTKKAELQDDLERTSELQKCVADESETYKAELESRKQELEAIRKAIRVLVKETKGAQQIKYGSVAAEASADFMQLSAESTHQLMGAVHLVQNAAKTTRSTALAQLADKMSDAMSDAATDADESANPFDLVKGMIKSMIETLEKQSRKETTRENFCRNEMKHVRADFHEKKEMKRKLRSRVQSTTVHLREDRERVSTLQQQIATMERERQKATELRTQQKDKFAQQLPEIEKSLEGVRRAIEVLKQYYGLRESDVQHKRKDGGTIVSVLEVIESDFAKLLVETKTTEETQKDNFAKFSKTSSTTIAAKTTEMKSLRTTVQKERSDRTEIRSDYSSVMEQVESVKAYKSKLKGQCTNQADQYKEREAQRQRDLEGLRQALEIIS